MRPSTRRCHHCPRATPGSTISRSEARTCSSSHAINNAVNAVHAYTPIRRHLSLLTPHPAGHRNKTHGKHGLPFERCAVFFQKIKLLVFRRFPGAERVPWGVSTTRTEVPPAFLFTNDLPWVLVASQPQKDWLPELAVTRPLGKLDLGNQHRFDPVALLHQRRRDARPQHLGKYREPPEGELCVGLKWPRLGISLSEVGWSKNQRENRSPRLSSAAHNRVRRNPCETLLRLFVHAQIPPAPTRHVRLVVARKGREPQEITKEVVGNRILLIRSLFTDGTPRRLLRPVSLAKPTSAPLRF
jgi:hypothetical protein